MKDLQRKKRGCKALASGGVNQLDVSVLLFIFQRDKYFSVLVKSSDCVFSLRYVSKGGFVGFPVCIFYLSLL